MPPITSQSNLVTNGIEVLYTRDKSFDSDLFGEPSKSVEFTQAGIPYAVMEGGPIIRTTASETSATEKYRIRGSDVIAFYVESFPPPIFKLGSSFQPMRRRMPGAPFLQTDSVVFEPHPGGLPGDPLNNDLAGQDVGRYVTEYIASIEYSTKPGENDAELSINAGGQFLSIPPNGTKIVRTGINTEDSTLANGTTVSGWMTQPPPGYDGPADGWKTPEDNRDRTPFLIQIPTVEYSMKLRRFRNPRFDLIDSHLGRVNRSTLKLFNNAPPETILFMAYTASQEYIWDGASSKVQPWSMELHYSKKQVIETDMTGEDGSLVDTGNLTFLTNPPGNPEGEILGTSVGRIFGWNHVLNSRGEWVEMRMRNGLKPYRTVEFNDFLPVDGQGRFAPELFI